MPGWTLLTCLVAAGCGGGGSAVEEPVTAASPVLVEAAASAASSVSSAASGTAAELAASAPATVPDKVIAAVATGPTDWLQPARGAVLPAQTPSEDWMLASRRISTETAWRAWADQRRAMLADWVRLPRERSDLIGGWMHDYVDPVTGAALTWTPETPEPPDGSTDAEARMKQAWVFYLRSYNIRMLLEAARLWRATGDTTWRDWSAAQLDFYAANYATWPVRTHDGRATMFRSGLDEATASFSLVEAARLLQGAVPATRYDTWKRSLFLPMAENLKLTSSPRTNIALWHAAGVARIALRYGDESLLAWALSETTGTRDALAAGLREDNLWAEGSFGYNAWVVDALYQLSLAAALEGRPDAVAYERQALGRLLLTPLDFRFDDGSLPTPGDSGPMAAIDAKHHGSLYRVLPTWWGVQKAATYQSWDTLLDPPPALPAEPVLPAVGTRHFPSVRMAVLRAGTWQAFVHYGQALANHAQSEALTFELAEGGTSISRDNGTVSYGSEMHVNWFARGASHNVPLVEGEGQAAWAAGLVEAFDPAASLLRVRHDDYQPGVQALRQWRLVADSGLVERTTLKVTNGSARRLGAAFHSACTMTPAEGLVPGKGSVPQNDATARWSDLVAHAAADGRFALQLDCGGRVYRYAVAGDRPLRVWLGTGPTLPLPARRGLLYYDVSDTSVEFTVTVTRVR